MSIFYVICAYFNWISGDLRIAFAVGIMMSFAIFMVLVVMFATSLVMFKEHGFSIIVKGLSLGIESLCYCLVFLSAMCLFARFIQAIIF